MSVPLRLPEVMAELDVLLAPRGFSLVPHPRLRSMAVLTHPDLEEAVRDRQFLNHGCATDSGVLLVLDPPELRVESRFQALATCRGFEPGPLAEALMAAGAEVARAHRAFVAQANPLHRRLLEQREAITQAGFHLVPTHFVTNLETRRELKRATEDRVDLIGVTLDGEGHLAATRLDCAFHRPVPIGTALKVMGLGVAK